MPSTPGAPSGRLPGLRLDPSGPLPLHQQAEQAMRRLLTRPGYAPGALLPDEVTLAASMGVSRNTLRAAIGRLVQEGRLERRAGVGTRVVEPKVHSGVGSWHSFTAEMAAKGITVQTYSVAKRMVAAGEEVAARLQIGSGTKVLCLDRVRGWRGRPIVHFRSYLHPSLRLTETDDFNQPLYQMIQARCGVLADQSDETLAAVPADGRLARCLQVKPGAPLLRRDRTVWDTRRRPMEYAIVHYRGEDFELSLNLRQP